VEHGAISNPAVIQAMKSVDRANYTKMSMYSDAPQPTLEGQTISAPHMHGYALELLAPNIMGGTKALDVGCGSGYLTTAMARMNPNLSVYGIETVPSLVELSYANIHKADGDLLQSGRVVVSAGDGWKGLRAQAPFDVIHVGAAAASLPMALLAQMKVGGRMLIPIGPEGSIQVLIQVDRIAGDVVPTTPVLTATVPVPVVTAAQYDVNVDNPDPPLSNYTFTKLMPVGFVPLVRK